MRHETIYERNQQIIDLFVNKCYTQTGIAKEFDISRERVRQVLRFELESYQIKELARRNIKEKSIKYQEILYSNKCSMCDKNIHRDRKFCSPQCSGKSKRLPLEVKKQRHYELMKKWRMRNRDKWREYCNDYYSKNKDKWKVYNKAKKQCDQI